MKSVQKKSQLKPKEGDLYAFKLLDGRFGVGLLARVETRAKRKPYGIFVYFFCAI